MKTPSLLALALSLAFHSLSAETQVLFFAKETKADSTRIALSIEDGEKVSGTKAWQPKNEHGARGYLDGIVNGDVIQVLWSYEIWSLSSTATSSSSARANSSKAAMAA
jgi:hypothetical protein